MGTPWNRVEVDERGHDFFSQENSRLCACLHCVCICIYVCAHTHMHTHTLAHYAEYRKGFSLSSDLSVHPVHSSMVAGWIFFILGTIIRYHELLMHVKENLVRCQI